MDPNAMSDISDFQIAVVCAEYSEEIVSLMKDSCLAELSAQGVAEGNVKIFSVPGALEIPLALHLLADAPSCPNGMIALGCVVRKETYHFEIVSDVSARGILDVQMRFGVPVANGVLTVDSLSQARVRASAKGQECARTVVRMAQFP